MLDGLTEEQHEEGKKIFDALRERIFRDDMLKSRVCCGEQLRSTPDSSSNGDPLAEICVK
ncbi:MAG TPA: hypothetical protein VMI94_01805 [Bryobacteraceae bacterium]|nr:hypothetical protein [Bryobacteraceae bacterium]